MENWWWPEKWSDRIIAYAGLGLAIGLIVWQVWDRS